METHQMRLAAEGDQGAGRLKRGARDTERGRGWILGEAYFRSTSTCTVRRGLGPGKPPPEARSFSVQPAVGLPSSQSTA